MAGKGGRGERRERERVIRGCDMIPISKLSQDSIGNPSSGKRSNFSSLSSVLVEEKKKGRKRKALSSRYSSYVHVKRRKLGLNVIKDNACVLAGEESNHKSSDLKDFDAIKDIAHVSTSGESNYEASELKDPGGVNTIKDIACVLPIDDLKHESSDLKEIDDSKNIVCVLPIGELGKEPLHLKELVSLTPSKPRPRGRPRKTYTKATSLVNPGVNLVEVLKDKPSTSYCDLSPRGRPKKTYTKATSPVNPGVNLEEVLRDKRSTSYHDLRPQVLSSDLSNLKAYKGDVSNSEGKLELGSNANSFHHANSQALELDESADSKERPEAMSGFIKTKREVSDVTSNRKTSITVKSYSKPYKATSFNSDDEDKKLPNDFDSAHKGVNKSFGSEGDLKHPLIPQHSNVEIIRNEETYSSNAKFIASSGILGVTGNDTPRLGISPDGRSLRPRKWLKREPENKLLPADYVGKRVVVYWPHAKAWFAGIVVEYDERSKKHKINYDDSDEECISFRRHKVMLEEPLEAQSAGDEYTAEKEDASVPKAGYQEFCKDTKKLDSGLEDENVIEDSGIVSSFSASHRLKELSVKPMCNGSVICSFKEENDSSSPSGGEGYCRSTDGSATEGFQEHETDKSVTCTTIADMGLRDTDRDKKIEFVYVRRPKTRKFQVPLADGDSIVGIDKVTVECSKPDLTENSSMRDNSNLLEEFQQHALPCKSEDSPMPQHFDQQDCSNAREIPLLTTDLITPSGAGGNSSNVRKASLGLTDINIPSEPDVHACEHTSGKRNTQFLKKLVSQGFKTQENKSTQGSIDLEAYDTQVHKVMRHAKKRMEKRHLFHCLNFNAGGHGKYALKFRKMGLRKLAYSLTPVSKLEAEALEEKVDDDCNDQFVYKSQTVFQITIQLLRPVLNADLFTWQFFNILVGAGFSGKGSFEDSICIKGSVHDFLGILRLLMSIIKSMSTTSWISKLSHKQWQARILYQLWIILTGCASWSSGLHGFLLTKAESILVEHLWKACMKSKMTARQILNVLMCYFIRPYIIATICEKGALFKAVIEQFMLLKPKKEGIPYIQKSLKCFQLQSGPENADSIFSSYLMHFLELKDWFSEKGVFLKQMKKWVASASMFGHAELMVPVPAVGRPNHLVLQVTTVRLGNRMYTSDGFERKAFLMKHNGANFHQIFDKSMSKLCSFEGDGALLQRSSSINGHDNLYSTLHLMLLLNRNLHHKNQPFPEAGLYLQERVCQSDKAYLSETCSQTMTREQDAKRIKGIVVPGDSFGVKQVKLEPDVNISRRSSSITTDSNSAQAIKEESSIEMYGQQLPLDSNVQEPDLKGQHDIRHPFKGELSGRVDHDYYVHKRNRDAKKLKKNRPHRNDEGHQNCLKMTRYAIADLVIMRGGTAWKGSDAKVKLQLTKRRECFVVVNQGEEMYVQKVEQGSNLIPSNPSQLIWKSDDDWTLEFCNKEQWDIFRRMYNGSVQRSAQTVPVKSLPIPGIRLIEDDALLMPGSFSRPHYAIMQINNEIESALRNNRVLYDLDSEDEAWLDDYNKLQSNIKADDNGDVKTFITDDVLERVIDLLEKVAYRQKEDSMGDNEDSIEVMDALRLYQDLAPADVVEAIHTYWLTKRLKKGKALVRHFQPPPREQYEKELKNWETMMAVCPPGEQKMLMEQFPRPQISAFCLECRDSVDRSKKMLRQRSQKRLKPSRSSSEDSHRASGFRSKDYSAWHSSYPSQPTRPSPFIPCRSQGQVHGKEVSENVQKARAKAVAARKVATMKTAKFRKRFLDFDATLQKAWALLIEYEASMGNGDLMASEAMKEKVELLFSWCSHAQEIKSSSEDEPPSDVIRPFGEDFLESFTKKCSIMEETNHIEVAPKSKQMLITHEGKDLEQTCAIHEAKMQEQALERHDDVLEEVETSPLLPISTRGYPYAWIGSTLLQKVDQQE